MILYGAALLLLSLLAMVYTAWHARDMQLGGETVLPVAILILCILGAIAGTITIMLGTLNMHIE